MRIRYVIASHNAIYLIFLIFLLIAERRLERNYFRLPRVDEMLDHLVGKAGWIIAKMLVENKYVPDAGGVVPFSRPKMSVFVAHVPDNFHLVFRHDGDTIQTRKCGVQTSIGIDVEDADVRRPKR